jgi:histidine decarboxylase
MATLDDEKMALKDPAMFFKSRGDVQNILAEFKTHLAERTDYHLGYPYNLKFNGEMLAPFLNYSINNLGDPFVTSNYGVHSRQFEVEVLNFFADLWEIPRDEYWGYCTTCGTEGNLLGVLYGREKLPNAILYCSRDTHYSVPKSCKLYRIPVQLVDSQPNGEIDYADLEAQLLKNKGTPAIVSFNAGTTVKGAVDSSSRVIDTLHRTGYSREEFYVHCDGALAGVIVPLLDGVDKSYTVSFQKEIDSISVSGHKMLGCPMPCGVVITRKEHMQRFASEIEYLNSTDTTIMGSRNGQAPLAMWLALQLKTLEGLKFDCAQCIRNAEFLVYLFKSQGIACDLNPMSTTVTFEKPVDQEFILRWQLACAGPIAHVVVMPSVTQERLRIFFKEYMIQRGDTSRL